MNTGMKQILISEAWIRTAILPWWTNPVCRPSTSLSLLRLHYNYTAAGWLAARFLRRPEKEHPAGGCPLNSAFWKNAMTDVVRQSGCLQHLVFWLHLFVVEFNTGQSGSCCSFHLMLNLLQKCPPWRLLDGDTSKNWFQLFKYLLFGGY